jgi:hypothetical protein
MIERLKFASAVHAEDFILLKMVDFAANLIGELQTFGLGLLEIIEKRFLMNIWLLACLI